MLILASKSPRRKSILEMLEVPYVSIPADTDETVVPGISPEDTVKEFSRRKAFAVKPEAGENDVILGMDTMVYLHGKLLGKPRDKADAYNMLKELSGNMHKVYTGYTVIKGENSITDCEITNVYFRTLSDEEIHAYIATNAPMDKAGAYGIQGKAATFVKRIEGDYFSVIGFPVCSVFEAVKKL